jgi:hypothetical protein
MSGIAALEEGRFADACWPESLLALAALEQGLIIHTVNDYHPTNVDVT